MCICIVLDSEVKCCFFFFFSVENSTLVPFYSIILYTYSRKTLQLIFTMKKMIKATDRIISIFIVVNLIFADDLVKNPNPQKVDFT